MPARDEQRLDAERIPAEDQPAGPLVEQGKGEHAAQAIEAGGAPLAPGLEQDLRVGGGPEPDAGGRQLPFQRLIVVDLAVVDDDQPILLERLVGRVRQVDDRQPAMAQTDVRAMAAASRRCPPHPARDARWRAACASACRSRPRSCRGRLCRTWRCFHTLRGSRLWPRRGKDQGVTGGDRVDRVEDAGAQPAPIAGVKPCFVQGFESAGAHKQMSAAGIGDPATALMRHDNGIIDTGEPTFATDPSLRPIKLLKPGKATR